MGTRCCGSHSIAEDCPNLQTSFTIKNVKHKDQIGSGSFGIVYKVIIPDPYGIESTYVMKEILHLTP